MHRRNDPLVQIHLLHPVFPFFQAKVTFGRLFQVPCVNKNHSPVQADSEFLNVLQSAEIRW
jgi:hypothetical protein